MTLARTDQLLREGQVAELIGFSIHTLRSWRSGTRQDNGPPWQKIGRSVVYPLSGVRSWMTNLRQGPNGCQQA